MGCCWGTALSPVRLVRPISCPDPGAIHGKEIPAGSRRKGAAHVHGSFVATPVFCLCRFFPPGWSFMGQDPHYITHLVQARPSSLRGQGWVSRGLLNLASDELPSHDACLSQKAQPNAKYLYFIRLKLAIY